MTSKDFAHLHVHTEYSMLDGAAKIKKLISEVKAQGQKSVAITDHGYCFGAYEFYKAATAEGIKPIIGVEAYVTPGTSRFGSDRKLWGDETQRSDDVSARGAYTHMTLLAENNTGLHNLFRMSSLASLEGQMGKWPRMDQDLLETYHGGLIATAGCPSGEVQTRLRLGQFDEAYRAAGQMQDLFGKDNYFVEVMDHNNSIERRVANELIELAKKIGAPIIATNDSHYVREEDAPIQDAMLCINSGSTLQDPDRFTFDGTGYHLRSSKDMWDLFGDIPGACENTLLIALAIMDAKIKDEPVPAIYGDEVSTIPVFKTTVRALFVIWKGFWRRIFYKYIVYNFHPIALFFLSGLFLGGIGLGVSIYLLYVRLVDGIAPSTGSVMLAVLPIILGFQLLLSAITMDMNNERKN